jgi:hypothetical protein
MFDLLGIINLYFGYPIILLNGSYLTKKTDEIIADIIKKCPLDTTTYVDDNGHQLGKPLDYECMNQAKVDSEGSSANTINTLERINNASGILVLGTATALLLTKKINAKQFGLGLGVIAVGGFLAIEQMRKLKKPSDLLGLGASIYPQEITQKKEKN